MHETLINALAQALHNNIGQRLTHELATGLATTVNQAALAYQREQAPAQAEPEGDAP